MKTGGNHPGAQTLAIAPDIAAAIDWWRLAGVEGDLVDDPQDWLASSKLQANPDKPTPKRTPKPPVTPDQPAIPVLGGPRESWPETLADFAAWWLSQPDLAPSGMPRMPPTGPARAPLMVLVAMPEADDAEGLLTGRAGALLDSLLRTCGLERDGVYLASALPARIAVPDWIALKEQGLGAVLERHVALAAPQRVLVFGQAWVSALLGNDSPQSAAHLRSLNHEQGTVAALATYELGYYLSKPAAKAGLWQRWLDWTMLQPEVGTEPS
ncbi:uracil-DNA glycosylase family protein [Novosphingobium sp.]|uniref:uracil-DNA glycosylase family protein n=1 Tax=Novosphingobium sp. TaxID=1874826 RepID=UPI0038B6DC12